jgi:hypothetical protein
MPLRGRLLKTIEDKRIRFMAANAFKLLHIARTLTRIPHGRRR